MSKARTKREMVYRAPGVVAVEVSENSKLGLCSATYVSQDSCPESCPLRGQGCYAEHDYTGFIARRLNRATEGQGQTAVDLAKAEAGCIDQLSGRLPLRLHVVGDCPTPGSARILGAAATRYRRKHGQRVWTYTHTRGRMKRQDWGPNVSVLRSCETPAEVKSARRAGWAAAIVVPEFPDGSSVFGQSQGVKCLPCPEQTGQRPDCSSCELCFDDEKLLAKGLTIAFEAHGRARRLLPLPVIQIQESSPEP